MDIVYVKTNRFPLADEGKDVTCNAIKTFKCPTI